MHLLIELRVRPDRIADSPGPVLTIDNRGEEGLETRALRYY